MILMHFSVSRSEIESAFAPAIRRQVVGDDPEWNRIVGAASPTIASRLRHWLRRPFSSDDVAEVYEEKWSKDETDQLIAKRFDMAGGHDPLVWGDRRFFANARGTKRVHLLYLMRLIETLKPKTVLEVGAGTGANLFILAARYPHIAFTGVELTRAGYDTAKDIRSRPAIPQPLVEFSPLPIQSAIAHQTVSLHQGSAAALPFATQSFDLVYTVQALEQMESIRGDALRQIARVSRHHAAMFEPFAEWNVSPQRRHKIRSRNYFSAAISDLPGYGLKPIYSTDDMPSKLAYGIGFVVAASTQQ